MGVQRRAGVMMLTMMSPKDVEKKRYMQGQRSTRPFLPLKQLRCAWVQYSFFVGQCSLRLNNSILVAAAGYNTHVCPLCLEATGYPIPDRHAQTVLSPGPAVSCVRERLLGHMCCKRDRQPGQACSCVRASRSPRWFCPSVPPQSPFTPCPTRIPLHTNIPAWKHSPAKPLDRQCRELERTHPPKMLAAA